MDPLQQLIGRFTLAFGAAFFLFCLGQVSRKLAEALRSPPWYRGHFVAAALVLVSPLGDILAPNGTLDWFTTLLSGGFVLSLAPTWLHWHWLVTGKDR